MAPDTHLPDTIRGHNATFVVYDEASDFPEIWAEQIECAMPGCPTLLLLAAFAWLIVVTVAAVIW